MIVDRESGSARGSLVVELASNDGYLLQHFVPTRRSGARHRSGGERRRGGRERGVETIVEFFGAELAERLVAERRTGRPHRRATTCSRRSRTSTTSWPASKTLLAAGGRRHGRGAARRPAGRGASQFDTIYHEHYSYFSSDDARATVFAATASRSFDVEELAVARRLAPGLRATRRGDGARVEPSVVERPRARERRRATTRSDRYARLRRPGRRDQVAPARAADPAPARREARRRLRRARARATPCSTTAASVPISSTTPSTATRTSTGRSCPARTFRSIRRSGSRRRGPTVILILPWNLAARDQPSSSRTRAEWGAQLDPSTDSGGRASACHVAGATGSARRRSSDEGRHLLRRARRSGWARTTQRIPKPMIPIGDRPILWHIMKYYAELRGHKEFILCLGYKARRRSRSTS